MVVIIHNGIGADVYGVYVGEKAQAGDDPLFTMIKILTGLVIVAAEISAAYAAHVTVVKRGSVKGDLFVAWLGHRASTYSDIISMNRSSRHERRKIFIAA